MAVLHDEIALRDSIDTKLAQARAMTLVAQNDAFGGFSTPVRNDYMEAITEKLDEIEELLAKVGSNPQSHQPLTRV